MSLRTVHISNQNQADLPFIAPTMPTPIRQLLDQPETLPPRPRRPQRFDPDGRRLPAGPAPPRSWLETGIWASSGSALTTSTREKHSFRISLQHLPGVVKWPVKNSLMDMTLDHIARHWHFHKKFDADYVSTLPTDIRSLLLSYIAAIGPKNGLNVKDFRRILRPGSDVLDFSGNSDLDRLDLSGSMFHEALFKEVEELTVSPLDSEEPLDQDDWNEFGSPFIKQPSYKIENLRYLSLAHPSSSSNLWADLLQLAPHLPTLTHLSLAGWSTPDLTPNSRTASMISSITRPIDYGATGYYAHSLDQDWSEAANVLRRLSSSLYCLEWLDLEGCSKWVRALRWSRTPGIDWVGKWGRVRTLKLRSGICVTKSDDRPQPGEFPDGNWNDTHGKPSQALKSDIIQHKLRIVEAMEVEKWIRQLRGWIDVQYDDFEMYDKWLDTSDEAKALNRRMMNEMKTSWVEEDTTNSSAGSWNDHG